MLKFTTVQLVDIEDMKGMIYVIFQIETLQCCELYANIKCNTVPTQTLNQYLINHNIIPSLIIHNYPIQRCWFEPTR